MIQSILKFIFPPLCLHCEAETERLFCKGCQGFFELIQPQGRCVCCFQESSTRGPCANCLKEKRWHIQCSAALDDCAPTRTFMQKVQQGHSPHLIKSAASFMVAQYTCLGWPSPDLLIPLTRLLFFRKNDSSYLLAKEIGKYLEVPVSPSLFHIKKNKWVLWPRFVAEEKVVLLIHPKSVSPEEIDILYEALYTSFPKRIYLLSLLGRSLAPHA